MRLATEVGFPVAVKVESTDLPHKTEADGVRLNVVDAGSVRRAFDSVLAAARKYRPEAKISGVLVQPMAEPGVELVLGLRRDPAFGPVIMVGLGGILVEVLKDVVFGAPPIGPAAAKEMISNLKGAAVLSGVRGKRGVSLDALALALCSLSQLALAHPEIVELDLNPVFGNESGVTAVDWLMVRDANA